MLKNWGLVEAEVATRYPMFGNPLVAPWMRLRRLLQNLEPDSRLWLVATPESDDSAHSGSEGRSAVRRPAWRDELELALHGRVTPNVRVISEDEFLGNGNYMRDFGSGKGHAPLVRKR